MLNNNSGRIQKVQRFEYKLEANGYISARYLVDSIRGYKLKAYYQYRYFTESLTINIDFRKRSMTINDVEVNFDENTQVIDTASVKTFAGIVAKLKAVAVHNDLPILQDYKNLQCKRSQTYISLFEHASNKRMYMRNDKLLGDLQFRTIVFEHYNERVATVQFAMSGVPTCKIIYKNNVYNFHISEVPSIQVLHHMHKHMFMYDGFLNLVGEISKAYENGINS